MSMILLLKTSRPREKSPTVGSIVTITSLERQSVEKCARAASVMETVSQFGQETVVVGPVLSLAFSGASSCESAHLALTQLHCFCRANAAYDSCPERRSFLHILTAISTPPRAVYARRSKVLYPSSLVRPFSLLVGLIMLKCNSAGISSLPPCAGCPQRDASSRTPTAGRPTADSPRASAIQLACVKHLFSHQRR
eukprot:CAMPEP_0198730180 /NCGR_PEP_ID=MMETSP1475-20131203/23233_1 /TAXON_ID= ORGANISM="Unidentified sp., Strain CCMP1999" /NCGR_SAMPLE_ID=MMETSP1475 /ASSEMBLY_ACC=CAM_ASM_001111 /LENGTH=194 /DNA_ID=CAMNT_0044492951 /DNA_START=54 /DNA_END=635 /DNA_ORIENTATION=-